MNNIRETSPEDLRLPETPPDTHRRLIEIEREKRQHVDALSRLSDESTAIIAALAGEPAGVADHVDDADHHDDAKPSPQNLIAVKPAAHHWRMTEKRLRRIAASHEALHKIGGRWMIDHDKLTAALFR